MTVRHVQEIEFGAYGGAELFFADIDGDGELEILAYQGPGVFGAGMYRAWAHVAAAYPRHTCLTAFRRDGTRLWTYGAPNSADVPYICHAHESCVAAGDVDGDGVTEVALADGERLVLLDGPTGAVRAESRLEGDNFFIVQVFGAETGPGEAAVVAKNGEGGIGDWRYGQPLLGLDAGLNPVWDPVAIPGAGHHIQVFDVDGDGRREYLVGYCLVRAGGEWACVVDAIDPASLSPDADHVDYTDVLWLPDRTYVLGLAGSSKAYLVEQGGGTRFVKPDKHVQGCCFGRFRPDSAYQLAIYNDDGPMVLYDPAGTELWRVPTEERWPLGMPQACAGHVFHRNRPVLTLPGAPDTILFTDGGWPWAMDGEGRVSMPFEPPPNSRQPEHVIPAVARADDMGYGFATKLVDWDGSGRQHAVVYDRRYLWEFPVSKDGR